MMDYQSMFSGFWNAFWLFLGIVAGAMVQYALSRLQQRDARITAGQVLKTEIDINLKEAERFRARLRQIKGRIGAGQMEPRNLFVSMQGFDYSALNPLVSSGFFHSSLGPERAEAYLEFLRFFNNNNANIITDILREEHYKNTSVQYIQWLEDKSLELEVRLRAVVKR